MKNTGVPVIIGALQIALLILHYTTVTALEESDVPAISREVNSEECFGPSCSPGNADALQKRHSPNRVWLDMTTLGKEILHRTTALPPPSNKHNNDAVNAGHDTPVASLPHQPLPTPSSSATSSSSSIIGSSARLSVPTTRPVKGTSRVLSILAPTNSVHSSSFTSSPSSHVPTPFISSSYPHSSSFSTSPPMISQSSTEELDLELFADCDRTITGDRGRFTSPDYPARSTRFFRCRVTIETRQGFIPVIVFSEFELMADAVGCSSVDAYVQINAIEDHPDRICGSQKPFSITADGSVVVVDMLGTPDAFHWFSATFYSIDMVNAHFIIYEDVIGRFDSDVHDFSSPRDLFVLHAEPGSRIYVSFEEVTASVELPVTIKDVVSRVVIAEFYDRYEEFSISSQGNELLIEFSRGPTSRLVFEYEVFRVETQPFPGCDALLTMKTGTIRSPGYPTAYPANLDCFMTIRVDAGYTVRLVFSNFSVEPRSSQTDADRDMIDKCSDYLQITDVTTDRTDRVCGDLHPFSWTSDSNELMLVFHTDQQLTSRGFYGQYNAFEDVTSDCIVDSGNGLHLQRFLGDHTSACKRLVSSDPNTIVVIEVYRFETPDNEDCPRHGIKIQDVVTMRSDWFCGSLPVFTWTSDANEVEIEIALSSFSPAAVGANFRAAYRSLHLPRKMHGHQGCKFTITDERGELNVPEVPRWPPVGNHNCFIVFHATPGSRFQLTVKDLVIDVVRVASPSDDKDGDLELGKRQTLVNSGEAVSWRIFDVSVLRADTGKGEEFTSSQPDFTWTSETNELIITTEQRSPDVATIQFRVEYRTERQITYDNFDTVGCGYVINKFPGVFSWSTPPNHCKVVFRARPNERVLIHVLSINPQLERKFVDDDCGNDYLEFRDVYTGRNERACFFEKNLSFSWLSEGNELSILVHGQNLNVPMNITYHAVRRPVDSPYQSFLIESSGELSATLHDIGNTAAEKCEIVLHANSNQRLNLQFCQFLIGEAFGARHYIGHGEECGETYVQVIDLTTTRTNRYCGQLELFSWTSDANVVQVSFRSMSNMVYRGFRAIYRTFQRNKTDLVRLVDGPDWNWLLHRFNATGYIASPNFPEPYPRQSRDEYILHTAPGKTIVLSSALFDLDYRDGCSGDMVEIADLGSDRAVDLCGYHGPFTWTSDTNEVKVTFSSNMGVEGRGFFFAYQAVSSLDVCVRVVELNATTVITEIQTDDITAAMMQKGSSGPLGGCLFVIQATPEFHIRMNFVDLMPVGFSTGSIEILEVLSSRLFNFDLSDSRPWSFTSEGNAIYVLVRAKQHIVPSLTISAHVLHRPSPPDCYRVILNPAENERLEYLGFEGIDHFVGFEESSADHSTVGHSDTNFGEFLSGFVPITGEPMSHDCRVIVRVHPSLRLTVVFSTFKSTRYSCSAHTARPVMEIEDSTSLRLESFRLCGVQQPLSWTSDSNDVLMRYLRHEAIQQLKIVAFFKSFERPKTSDVACSKVLTDDELTIASPNFPKFYSENLNCQTIIHASPNRRIQIVFTTFRLEGIAGSDCTQDYLEISDLMTGRADRACGNLLHYAFTSDANEVLIRLVSDDFIDAQGYQANYVIQDRLIAGSRNASCNQTFTEEEGIFSSPDFLTREGEEVYCQYLIHATPSFIITLQFGYFEVEKNPACKTDYIEILDTAFGMSETYCGSYPTLEYTSMGNEIEITYHTSGTRNNQGFTTTYKILEPSSISDCDEEFTTPQIFTSPAFSSDLATNVQYANNLDCKYTFMADSMKVVELVFLTFHLEESENCVYDYVEVQTAGIGSPQRYCGVYSEFLWTSTGSSAVLRFHSDHIVAGRGFRAEFNTIPMEPSEECSLSFSSSSGSFTSPGYPDDYPNNRNCKYRIMAPPDHIVNITFIDFQLEFHQTCSYDYVQIYNEPMSGSVSPRFCGPRRPFAFLSETNQVVVEFNSDSSVGFRGFAANFTSVSLIVARTPTPVPAPLCHDQKFVDRDGVLTSPNFPFNYDNDEHCRIDIEVPDEMSRIQITFHFLDVEEHHDCKWDFVRITDVRSRRQSDRLCGTVTDAFTWDSDSNQVTLTFQSDGLVTRKGFFATYQMLPGNEVNRLWRDSTPP